MKAQAPQISQGSEGAPLVATHHALGGIFDDGQMVGLGNSQDRVHFTGHPCVMHGDNGPGPGSDGRFNQGLIQIIGVGPDVYEDWYSSTQGKGVGRGDEGVGGHDDLISRSNVEQQGRHLQGSGAGVGEEGHGGGGEGLQGLVAFFGVGAITGEAPCEMGLSDIKKLFAGHVGSVEGDGGHGEKWWTDDLGYDWKIR